MIDPSSMKLIAVFYIVCLCCIISCSSSGNQAKVAETGEKVEIPDAVKTNLAAMYPTATGISWEMRDGKYEASFTQKGMPTTIILIQDGTILKYKVKIDPSLLPQKITDYISGNLGGKKVTAATKITEPKGMTSYEVAVDTSFYMFAGDGMFVGKEDR